MSLRESVAIYRISSPMKSDENRGWNGDPLRPTHSTPFLPTRPLCPLLTHQGMGGAPRPRPLRLRGLHQCSVILSPGQRRRQAGGASSGSAQSSVEVTLGSGPLWAKHWFPLSPSLHLSSFNLLNLGRLYLHPGYTLNTNPQGSQPSNIS